MENWWKNSVVYQIYPRSFRDSDGDGIGDLKGITQKLDYLKLLGVDAIWMSPVFKSPNDDNGYDISDYRDIMDEFGTMEDMECLIAEAGKRGIRIIVDIVANHTSDEHKWFEEAKKSRENPYRDYYIFRDNVDGTVPNGLTSLFSGSAWEYQEDTDSYYLHVFSKKQPDLNYANPKVRQEIIDILNFWIDKGVGGFRLDVIENIGKEPDREIIINGPKLHDYVHEMYEQAFSRGDLMTVGECWGADEEKARLYTDPKRGELSMVFQFEHVTLDEVPGEGKWCLKKMELADLKRVFTKWQNAFHGDGWNTLFWNNHDLPRIVSRYGNDGAYRVESAKMLATLLHGMQGTPYIYQGEEIGMTNIQLPSIDDYEDIETLNMYKEKIGQGADSAELMRSIYAKSRDNARTPMQWSSKEHAGFTTGKPWFAINPNYATINVEDALEDEYSIFYYYKKLIALRKQKEIFVEGDYHLLLAEHPDVFAYVRTYNDQALLVICNFYDREPQISVQTELAGILGRQPGAGLPSCEILLSNYEDCGNPLDVLKLRPYEAILCELT
ncbi:MAG: alpha-glucosidase [Lachnospiraceae bacterium]|nr:alpha-glucosidase [Lachnospiraceae bacterium]